MEIKDVKQMISKEELELINNPEALKVYLDFKLEALRIMTQENKEKAERELQERERVRQLNNEFWSNVLIGAGVLCDYFAENNQTQKITK
jgi:F0F1-type ATP synthase assembly protein I